MAALDENLVTPGGSSRHGGNSRNRRGSSSGLRRKPLKCDRACSDSTLAPPVVRDECVRTSVQEHPRHRTALPPCPRRRASPAHRVARRLRARASCCCRVEVPKEDRLYYQEIDFVVTRDTLVSVSRHAPEKSKLSTRSRRRRRARAHEDVDNASPSTWSTRSPTLPRPARRGAETTNRRAEGLAGSRPRALAAIARGRSAGRCPASSAGPCRHWPRAGRPPRGERRGEQRDFHATSS